MNELLNMLFTGQDGVGLAVNVVIAILFVVGLQDVLRSRVSLAGEARWISAARRRLAAGMPQPDGPVDLSAASVLRMLGVPGDCLFGLRIGRMLHLRQAGLNYRDVLQQLTTEKVEGYGALARQIGASLTLLGLLGTVFGLSLALLSIGDASGTVKSVDDLSKLSRALGGTLSGMRTAFGCTLAGLIGSIALSFMNYMVRRSQSRVLQQMEEFLVCELVPSMERVDPDADAAAKAFAGVLIGVGADLEKVRGTVVDAAAEFKSGSEQMSGVVAILAEAMKEFSSGVSQITGYQTSFSGVMTTTGTALAGVQSVVERSMAVLEERLNQMRESANQNAATQKSILQYQEQHKEFVRATMEEFRSSFERLVSGHVSGSQKSVDQILSQHLAGLKAVAEDQRQVLSSVSDMLLDVHLNGRAKSHAGAAAAVAP